MSISFLLGRLCVDFVGVVSLHDILQYKIYVLLLLYLVKRGLTSLVGVLVESLVVIMAKVWL